jgi:hypothetical protein
MSRPSDFWSRRKARVEAEAQEEKRKAEAAEAQEAQAALAEKPDAEILEELGLPDPDTLEPGQDIAAFMDAAVPERLRRRALRQLWRLNPVLANLDGLNDYDGDFTNAVTDAPGVKTAYQVGKGLLKHVEAMEAEQEARDGVHSGEDTDTPQNLSEIAHSPSADEDPAKVTEIPEILQDNANPASASTTIVSGGSEYADGTPSDTLSAEPARPRRMRFRIESETE